MSGSNRLPTLAAEIKAAHSRVLTSAKTVAEFAIEAGRALLEAKGLVKHGQWLPWLREHCPGLSERTCQLYMAVARSGLNPQLVADLGLEAVARKMPVPPPEKEFTTAAAYVGYVRGLQGGAHYFFIAASPEHPGYTWATHIYFCPEQFNSFIESMRRPIRTDMVGHLVSRWSKYHALGPIKWDEWRGGPIAESVLNVARENVGLRQ